MKLLKACLFYVLTSLIVLCPILVESNECKQGIVYAYGDRVDPPFEFTGIGGDTLYLNGIPYYPVRNESNKYKYEQMSDEIKMRYQKIHNLHIKAREIAKEKASNEYEYMKYYADEMSKHEDLVEYAYVIPDSTEVCVKYKNINGEEFVTLSLEPVQINIDRLEIHQRMMDMFWRTINKGGAFAYGVGYRMSCPKSRLAKSLEAINRAQNGEILEKKDFMNTMLQNPSFRAELYRKAKRIKGE